jgi:hypothetical protein
VEKKYRNKSDEFMKCFALLVASSLYGIYVAMTTVMLAYIRIGVFLDQRLISTTA